MMVAIWGLCMPKRCLRQFLGNRLTYQGALKVNSAALSE